MRSLFSSRGRGPLALVAAMLAGATLSGCSVAGTSFDPGVAARVDGRTITSDEVDRIATGYCGYYEKQLIENNSVAPLRVVKVFVVRSLTLNAAVTRFGEGYGVTPGDQYRREVAAVQADSIDVPQAQTDAILLEQTTIPLVQDIIGQVGAEIAADAAPDADSDVDGSTPAAASQEALDIGIDAFGDWLDEHQVKVDPKYDVQIGLFEDAEGQLSLDQPVDRAVSFAVSDAAKAGSAADDPDPAATMELPASQRCGRYSAGAPATS